MKKIHLLLALLMLPNLAQAQTFNEAQRTEIESIVKQLLTQKEPQLVVQAIENLEKQQQEAAKKQATATIKEQQAAIFNNAADPVVGNPKGDVTIVEFYDYQCGFCKRAHAEVSKLLAADTKVRYVYKNFPVLGPASETAARAALAAHSQGKFVAMHNALMENKAPLTDASIEEIAKKAGLDMAKLKPIMGSEAVTKQIEETRKLAEALGGRGTPLFVIGEQTYPGAMPLEAMQKIVADQRAAQSAPAKP